MTHFLEKGIITSSIYPIRISNALVKPKGVTNNSNRNSLVLKVVFHISKDSMGVWWYHGLRSNSVNNLASSNNLL